MPKIVFPSTHVPRSCTRKHEGDMGRKAMNSIRLVDGTLSDKPLANCEGGRVASDISSWSPIPKRGMGRDCHHQRIHARMQCLKEHNGDNNMAKSVNKMLLTLLGSFGEQLGRQSGTKGAQKGGPGRPRRPKMKPKRPKKEQLWSPKLVQWSTRTYYDFNKLQFLQTRCF